MKVRIVNRPTGLLNGREWPDVGEVLEVTDEIGADMCAAGLGVDADSEPVETAVPVDESEKAVPGSDAETAVPSGDDVETADKPSAPRGRKPKAQPSEEE